MSNAPTPVTVSIRGYRQLSAEDQALINEIKDLGEHVRHLVGRVQSHAQAANDSQTDAPFTQVTNPSRWAAMAMTDLQVGFMKLVRAVAQPTSF